MRRPVAAAASRLAAVFIALFLGLAAAHAVLPDEILDDPELERRARAISLELRCMVCQNQSIDDSDAALARDLRVLVRERLVEGDTDAEVFDYVVSRYGEFVLLRPRLSARTVALWGAPLIVLVIGIGAVVLFLRQSTPAPAGGAPLSEAEQAELDALLKRRSDEG